MVVVAGEDVEGAEEEDGRKYDMKEILQQTKVFVVYMMSQIIAFLKIFC